MKIDVACKKSGKLMFTKGLIEHVHPDSIAEELGIKPGDRLLKINNRVFKDVIDYRLLTCREKITLLVESTNGEIIEYDIEKDFDEELGLRFFSPTIDPVQVCCNRCIFCFVDQLPPNLRSTLYLKDDDYRLSFLHGSFITLNNLTEKELERIKRLKLSPLYVSVHTTDDKLRQKMMQNLRAAGILSRLKNILEYGINIHAQIVLCPGTNDGEALKQTVFDLASLGKGILSVAIVPVGLTKHRRNLFRLQPVTRPLAQQVLEDIHCWQKHFKQERGSAFVFASDEFYLQAGVPLPSAEQYEGYPQLENGVGLSRLFIDKFKSWRRSLPQKKMPPLYFSLVTGKSALPLIKKVVGALNEVEGLNAFLYGVENKLFGKQVTVAGLLSGRDLIAGLQSKELGSFVVFPQVMLKEGEALFLDGLTPENVSEALGVPLYPVADLDDLGTLVFDRQED
jgi:putative radical SAM enzyme (TIGR03279 family)